MVLCGMWEQRQRYTSISSGGAMVSDTCNVRAGENMWWGLPAMVCGRGWDVGARMKV